jgi:hypothetical protein
VTATHATREAWLIALVAALRPWFDAAGFPLPDRIRATCGFPAKGALARRHRRVGECWSPTASGDQTHEVSVSPVVADAVDVGGILVHELCHAAVGVAAGHKGPFARCARALGLEGKMTATTSSAALVERLAPVLAALGPYPHAALSGRTRDKVAGTRLLKASCPACGYIVRVTRRWLDVAGAPICPCNGEPMQEG